MKTYKNRLPGVSLLSFALVTGSAQAGEGAGHTVRINETLLCLAGEYLGDPQRWPELLALNPQIESPKTLEIGDRLRLPQDSRFEPIGDRFICQPQWIPQGWRTLPTAKRARLARYDPTDRQLTLAIDQHLHAKPKSITTTRRNPPPPISPAPGFVSGIPLETSRSPDSGIHTGADGAFYIVTGGNVLAQTHPKPTAAPTDPVPVGRNIVIDRALVNRGDD